MPCAFTALVFIHPFYYANSQVWRVSLYPATKTYLATTSHLRQMKIINDCHSFIDSFHSDGPQVEVTVGWGHRYLGACSL